MNRILLGAVYLLALIFAPSAFSQIASFPGAVGYGGTTAGAYSVTGTSHFGGKVYHVTNLNDSGAGSFRTGVATSGNVVVFDVGGSIQILSPVSVTSNICIEGQTAPGGIQIYGSEVSLSSQKNIVIRYMHFRDGTLDPNYPGSSSTNSHTNAINMGSTSNIILDHCCFEFAAYNNIDSAGAVNITISDCLFGDPIAEQRFNCHFETGPVTFIDNLWANSHGRNPLGKGDMQFVNNIVYNYQFAMTTGDSSGAFHWDVINNYFIAGPITSDANDDYYQVDSTQQAFAMGNILDSNLNGALDGGASNSVDGAKVLSTYWFPNVAANDLIATTSLPTLSTAAAFYQVVSIAGPVPHDPVDSQIVANVMSLGTKGGFWTSQTTTGLGNDGYGVIVPGQALPDADGSGMPDDWKAANSLSLTNPAISGSTSSTGYTFLENYLAWKAQPNTWVPKNTAATPTSVAIDLTKYSDGFSTNGTYTVTNAVDGTVTQSGAGGSQVLFTPTLNTPGLGGFKWSVANSTTTMSSTFGVLISQNGPSSSLTWKGDNTGNNWDASTANWTVVGTGSSAAFAFGDPVTFDDTGSTAPSINLKAAVTPASVTINNFANNYVLTGTGIIMGTTALVEQGNAIFTISNTGSNSYSGGTDLNSGVLDISTSTALAAGAVSLNGGDLEVVTTGSSLTVANAIAVNEASTLGNKGAGVTFNGAGSGAAPLAVNFNSNNTITFGGSWAAYSGSMTLFGTGNLRLNNSASWGLPASTVFLNPGAIINNRSTASTTIPIGSLSGTIGSSLNGSDQSAAGTTATYSIGSLNTPAVFAGTINNGSSQATGITKVGSSTLTLTGDNTYTGPTTVSAGMLISTGTLGNTNVIINSGASFLSQTYVSGSSTLNSGGNLYIGSSTANGSPGTLTLNGGLGISGGTIHYDLSNSPTATGSNDLLVVNGGAFNLSGSVTFAIYLTNGSLSAGNYILIDGGAKLNTTNPTLTVTGLPSSSLTRQQFALVRPASGSTLNTSSTTISLSVTGTAGNLEWTGTSGAIWDLNTTANWTGVTNNSTNTFFDLDTVTFDDSNAGGSVTLSGALQANGVNVSGNNSNYTFAGTGGFSGSVQLVKSGSGTLTIANSGNSGWNGAFYVNAGTVLAEASLGSATIYLNGGTLQLGGGGFFGGFPNSFVVQQSSTIIESGTVFMMSTAGNTLTSSSAVTLNIQYPNIYFISNDMTGFIGTIESGTSAGILCYNSNGTNSNSGSAKALIDLGTGSAKFANRNGNASITFGAIAGGPNTTLSGRFNGNSGGTESLYTVGAMNIDTTFAGTITNAGDVDGLDLTKVGTGNWTLSGTSTFVGDVFVQQGTLTITGSDNDDNSNFEVGSGAAFVLGGGTLGVSSFQVDASGTFTGNGVMNGDFTNGGVTTVSGGSLTINGNYENDGTMTVDGSSTLVVNFPSGGSGFVNNGLLDIMDSPQTVLPDGFVNNGTILDSSLVKVGNFSMAAGQFTVSIQSFAGHTYQLQRSQDLSTWQNVGGNIGGTGSTIVLTDSNAAGAGTMYRVGVGP